MRVKVQNVLYNSLFLYYSKLLDARLCIKLISNSIKLIRELLILYAIGYYSMLQNFKLASSKGLKRRVNAAFFI